MNKLGVRDFHLYHDSVYILSLLLRYQLHLQNLPSIVSPVPYTTFLIILRLLAIA